MWEARVRRLQKPGSSPTLVSGPDDVAAAVYSAGGTVRQASGGTSATSSQNAGLPLPAPPLPKSKAPPPRPPMLKARPMRKQRSQRGNLLGGTEAIREAKKILHNVRLFGWGNGQNQPRLKVRGHASPCTVGSFSDC